MVFLLHQCYCTAPLYNMRERSVIKQQLFREIKTVLYYDVQTYLNMNTIYLVEYFKSLKKLQSQIQNDACKTYTKVYIDLVYILLKTLLILNSIVVWCTGSERIHVHTYSLKFDSDFGIRSMLFLNLSCSLLSLLWMRMEHGNSVIFEN